MNEEFLDEKILSITSLTPILSISKIPWFADFAYFLVGDYLPKDLTYQQMKKFFFEVKALYLGGFLYKFCADQVIRRCVAEVELILLTIVMMEKLEVTLMQIKLL